MVSSVLLVVVVIERMAAGRVRATNINKVAAEFESREEAR
jgi:hypothetical protein